MDEDALLREWRADLVQRHGVEFFSHEPSSIDIAPAVSRWFGKSLARLPAQQKESYHDFAKPLSFEGEASKHLSHFTGREWVAAKLEDWLTKKRTSKVFCLVGGPGIGKSAIACHWSHLRKDVLAFHHCVHGHKDKTDPNRILLSLAAQMAARLPEYQRRLSAIDINDLDEAAKGDARAVFDTFFLKPLAGDFPAPDCHQLIIIDALDEASRDQDNELASFIGDVWSALPEWLRLVVTTRPELDVSSYLENLHPFILNAGSPENLQDIRTFLRRELDATGTVVSDKIINSIVDKSEGLFLYAKVVLDEIREGRLSVEQTSEFPEGLTGYYKRWFDRKFPNRNVYQRQLHKLVSTITAQRAPLPLNILARALELSPHTLQQRLLMLGVLFPLREEQHLEHKITFVTLMHKSLHDWLTEVNPATLRPRAGAFAADLELGNRVLADEGWTVYSECKLKQYPYFSHTLLSHLSDAQQIQRLTTVLLDPALVETLWSGELRYEWQRHISHLRHVLSLTDLVREWVTKLGDTRTGTTRDAVVAGKLGRLFQEIGAFDEAILLGNAALAIWQVQGVSDSPEMVGTLLALARIQCVRDELEGATANYEKALAIAQRAYSPNSEQMADVLYQLCVFYKDKRDYKKSWEALEKSLAIYSRSTPPNYVGMANCINDKAVLLTAEGRTADYLEIYRDALTLFERGRPEGHPEMIATLCNVGTELRKQSKYDEGLSVLRRAVEMAKEILLPQHEYAVGARTRLVNALLADGKYDDALDAMRALVADLERFPGPDHEETASARLDVCRALLRAWHLSDATCRARYLDELRAEAHRVRQASAATILGILDMADDAKVLGEIELHDFLLTLMRRICREHAARPRALASEATAAQCFVEVLERLTSDTPLPEVAPEIRTLWERAEPELKHQADCLPRTRKLILGLIAWAGRCGLTYSKNVEGVHHAFDLISTIGADVPDTLDQLSSLAVALHWSHHHEMSESLCERLVQRAERILGAEHVQTLAYLENLAFIQMYQRKLSDAEHLYRRAMQARLRAGGADQSRTHSTVATLAECLLLQQHREEARGLVNDFVATLPVSNTPRSARKTFAECLNGTGVQLKNEFAAFEEARLCYEMSLELDDENATTHNNMAMLLWGYLKAPHVAAEHFLRSLALEPTDGHTHSNYAHLLAQTVGDSERAAVHFDRAMSCYPNDNAIPGNYAAMLLQRGELARAWELSKRAMRLCLASPNRMMVRPLFCGAGVLLLGHRDACVPLGQMKTLFTRGIDHVAWIITALLKTLDQQLEPDASRLMRAIAEAISDKSRIEDLAANEMWMELTPVSLETPWPDL